MAYWRYDTEKSGRETKFTRRGAVTLAGGGLIQSAWVDQGSPKAVGWTVGAAEMLRSSEWDPATNAIVIDTAPSRDSVSLFQLLAVSGWRERGWSPVMLHLRELWWDTTTRGKGTDEFKQSFKRGVEHGQYVRSVLYLNASWNWGGNSRSSAALLTENVWDYFVEASSKVSKAYDELADGNRVAL
jgi:hypothetical protein